jgi:hypothetical protein
MKNIKNIAQFAKAQNTSPQTMHRRKQAGWKVGVLDGKPVIYSPSSVVHLKYEDDMSDGLACIFKTGDRIICQGIILYIHMPDFTSDNRFMEFDIAIEDHASKEFTDNSYYGTLMNLSIVIGETGETYTGDFVPKFSEKEGPSEFILVSTSNLTRSIGS